MVVSIWYLLGNISLKIYCSLYYRTGFICILVAAIWSNLNRLSHIMNEHRNKQFKKICCVSQSRVNGYKRVFYFIAIVQPSNKIFYQVIRFPVFRFVIIIIVLINLGENVKSFALIANSTNVVF